MIAWDGCRSKFASKLTVILITLKEQSDLIQIIGEESLHPEIFMVFNYGKLPSSIFFTSMHGFRSISIEFVLKLSFFRLGKKNLRIDCKFTIKFSSRDSFFRKLNCWKPKNLIEHK